MMYRSGDLSANLEMDNGDTVFVRRAPVFYIYGEVQRAGTYRLEPNTSVMQAISLGGGITMRGTERGLRINRRSADGNLTRVDAQLGDLVKADDIIYVSESLF
jgi:polysaccharide export outer membrane protein